MKKLRKVNGKPVLFIQKSDIRTLYACKDFIRKEVFTEPAIVNRWCDDEGFYRIEDPENIKFISSLGYIPDYDELSRLSKEEIGALADQALAEKHKIEDIIRKLCTYKQKLTKSERRTLESADYLKHHYDDIIEGNVLNAGLENTMFCAMEDALFAQIHNYINTLIKLADEPTLPSNGSKRKHF